MNNKCDYLYKIVFIGDSTVGKTDFIKRCTNNTYCKTIGK